MFILASLAKISGSPHTDVIDDTPQITQGFSLAALFPMSFLTVIWSSVYLAQY